MAPYIQSMLYSYSMKFRDESLTKNLYFGLTDDENKYANGCKARYCSNKICT
jgi:hypothetical protein